MTVVRTVNADVPVYADPVYGITAGTGTTNYRIEWVEGLLGQDVEDALVAEDREGMSVVLRYDGEDAYLDVTFPFDDTPGEMESPPSVETPDIIQAVWDLLFA